MKQQKKLFLKFNLNQHHNKTKAIIMVMAITTDIKKGL